MRLRTRSAMVSNSVQVPESDVLWCWLCMALCSISLDVLHTLHARVCASENLERRGAIPRSYGTYDGNVRGPDGRIDCERLVAELSELHANTYNWLIAHAATDWEDLHTFLPLAAKHSIRVWVTLLPP